MRTLFVSFTSLVKFISKNQVTQDELDTGLFYFGCTREHIFEDYEKTEAKWFFKDNPEKGRLALKAIQDAVSKAQKEGRAAFRTKKDEHNSYSAIWELLNANGIVFADSGDFSNPDYNYYNVQDFFGHVVSVKF